MLVKTYISFYNVKQGNHVMFRDYNFIASTPYNRLCFISKYQEIYSQMIASNGN